MKIYYKYSYVAKTVLLSLFYIVIFPFGVLISLIGFIFAYYLELYNFTHLYNRPEMINEKICLFYTEYFVANLFILNLGVYIFIKDVFFTEVLIIIILVILGILSIFPYTKLISCDFLKIPKKILINTTLYEDSYFSFYNDYQRQNPMTKKDGLKNYITKLRINGYISQKVYNFAFMNIDNINVMELYYKSRLNQNIVKSQVALANYNNSTYRNSIKPNKKRKKINDSFINNKKEILGSGIYDEQLTNLLRKSIYKQKFGNNLDNLNKILSNKNIFTSSNTNIDIEQENSSNKKEDEIKSDSTMNEKNREYILKQYENPFLLSINHNITIGDLNIVQNKKLEKIKEVSEQNENSIIDQNKRDKNFYGVDFDIYSNKSSSSIFSEKSKNKEINIEMEDLSEKNKQNNYETIKDINVNKKNNKKLKQNLNNNEEDSQKNLKEYFLNITKGENNYDGDNDSDSD